MASKKLIKFILCFMAVAILIPFFILLTNHVNKYKDAGHLPQMVVKMVNGSPYNTDNLQNFRKPLLINFFHPECNFCLMEAQEILKNQSALSDVQMLFITFADSETLKTFLIEYPLDTIPNVIVTYDPDLQFTNYFNVKGPPVSFIYDRNMNLVKVLEGYKSFNFIRDALNDAKF